MTEKHTPTLEDIAADRGWWSADAGKHYRELANRLRGIAAKCRRLARCRLAAVACGGV